MQRVMIMMLTVVALLLTGIQPPAIADTYACKTECLTCKKICEKTLKHCTEVAGEHAQPDHLNIMKDCIEACGHAAAFTGKKGSVEEYTWNDTCKKCIDACQKCADMCDSMIDDKVMQRCARECKMCIKALKARWGYNDSIHGTSSR